MSQTDYYKNICQDWLARNLTTEAIWEEIQEKYQGGDHEEVLWTMYKKAKADRLQQRGFLITALGAILCFVSCVMTMINPFPEMVGLFLYGLTSVGLVVIFTGLYLVFEP